MFQIQSNNYDQSEWHLKNVHLYSNFSSTVSVGIIELNPVEIVYSLRLKRSTLFYNKVFCGPLLGFNQTLRLEYSKRLLYYLMQVLSRSYYYRFGPNVSLGLA